MGVCSSKSRNISPDVAGTLAIKTHFTKDEISRWYTGFMKDCPTGVLDIMGFKKLFHHYFPSGNPDKFSSIIFKLFDENQDGLVDFPEFVTALSISSRGSIEERLEWSFRLYDLDQDGYISQEELSEVVQAIYLMVGSSVKMAEDEDTPEKKCDKLLSSMDLNKDGRISKEEFIECSKTDPSIVQALSLYDSMNSRKIGS